MRYIDALEEARKMLSGMEDERDIVVFRVTTDDSCDFQTTMTDACLSAVAMAYDDEKPATIERQRGGEGPWVSVRKVTVSWETTDPEVKP